MNTIKSIQNKINRIEATLKVARCNRATRVKLGQKVIKLLQLQAQLEQLQQQVVEVKSTPISTPAPNLTPPTPSPTPDLAPIKAGDRVHYNWTKIIREYPDGTYSSCVISEIPKTVHGTVYATKGGKLRVKVEGEKPEDLYDRWGRCTWIKSDPDPVQLEMWAA